jgi:hypothetical protein
MSFWSILGKALGLVPAVVEAVSSIAQAATKKAPRKPLERPHFWAQGNRCVYCGKERSPEREQQLCSEVSL